MKGILTAVLMICLLTSQAFSQNNGSLTMRIVQPGGKDAMTLDLAMKGNKVLLKPQMGGNMPAGMGGMKMLYDLTTMDYLILMENNGNKMGVKQNLKEQMTKESAKSKTAVSKVVETKETKVIDGFKCKKYIITSGNSTSHVWATKDVKLSFKELSKGMLSLSQGKDNNNTSQLDNLDGFPVLIESMENKGGKSVVTSTIEFKNVKENNVTDDMFSTEGYTFMGQ